MKKLSTTMLAIVLTLFVNTVMAEGKSPENVAGSTKIDSSRAKQLFDSGVAFIDIRRNSDWEAGRIPDAIHLELKGNFTETSLSAEVGKNEPLVCYCNGINCMRSSTCSEKAVSWGFTKVFYYRDGFPAWKDAGYPVE